MKTLFKTVGAILVCLILLLVVLSITGFGPHDRTPGLWLKGNVVTTPVTDLRLCLSCGNPEKLDNVIRDPHVRMKIGDRIYDRTVALVTDPAEQQGVLEARSKKYPQLKVSGNPTIHVFRVVGD